jgi:hypothetical protein
VRSHFEETFVFRIRFLPAVALALLWQSSAFGASDAELADIRNEIRSLKASYEARIQALEQRLKEAEARAAAPVASTPPSATAPAPVALAAPASRTGGSASAFNPAISAILTGTYANLSRDPRAFAIPGFSPEGEIGPGRRGFGLGESELVLSANVDPHFAGTLILAVTPEDTVGVEEAYGQFLTAPLGLAPKFGRFLSGVGYLNEQHAHAWDFVDAPLAYQAFFGGQYRTDGVQVKWIAPFEHFVELGGEIGNGDAYPGSERSRNGAGASAVFAHAGGDIGTSHSWRAGLSYLRTRSEDEDGATAASRIAVADFTWKYAPHGNIRETYAKVQGEYFAGKVRDNVRQSGWYLQGVYQFLPEWRAGIRFDRLDPRGVDDATYAPRKASVMLDYNPSEFSRIRLQFARSQLLNEVTDNQWFVQYILSLGAHGAHKY